MQPIAVIAGGSGMIGSRLTQMLEKQGYTVRLLSRSPKGPNQFAWNPAKNTLDLQALEGAQTVINLAGEGIADGRWTQARKQSILDSRVQSSRLLRETIRQMQQPPAVYLSASAIGYYGNSGDRVMTETDQPADSSFMVEVSQAWEKAALDEQLPGVRTCIFRIGIVLAAEGGALPELLMPLRFGVAAYFSNGQAWWSWIHLDDLCRMFLWALENPQAEGVYNAVGPKPVRNLELLQAVREVKSGFSLKLPAPAFALRLMLGEMSAVVLNSNRVSSEKIQQAGFAFRFRDVKEALKDILST